MAYTTPTQSYYQKVLNSSLTDRAAPVNLPKSNTPTIEAQLRTVAPTVATYNRQAAATTAYRQLLLTTEALTITQAQKQAGYQLGQLGLKKTQLGIQAKSLTQQRALQQYQNALELAEYQRQFGVFPEELKEYQIQQTQYPEQYAQAAFTRYSQTLQAYLTHRNTLLQTRGALAAGGAQGTVGGKQQLTTLAKQYGLQLQQIGKQYGWTTENIARTQALSKFTLTNIARTKALTELGQKGTLASELYSTQQIQNAQKNLTILAQSNGLSQQEVITRLNAAIAQEKLGVGETIIGILTKISALRVGEVRVIGTALSPTSFFSATGLNVTGAGT